VRWSLSKIRARILLGWWFAVAFLGRLKFWNRRQARQTLLARYRADSLTAVSENERASFPRFQKCLACSLCTFSCTAIREGRAVASFEPKFLMLAYGRSSRDSEVFREEWFPCAECGACTVECPNDVPIHALIETIRARRGGLGFRS
jgi:heterodisulfide reductase subunit C